MVNQVEPKLIEPLVNAMQQERFVTLATVDFETGGPNVSAISWTVAKDEQTIVFAVDNRSRIVRNINNNPLVIMNVIANESTYSISGKATVKEERIDDVPLKLALIELDITEVRDVMFYGAKIVSEPVHEITYDKKAAERLNNQVIEVLRKA